MEPGKKKHPFQANHSLRKWFKTRCEIAGMKPINVEKLMNHSIGIGISDSYYRATEKELLDDYCRVVELLLINDEKMALQKQVTELTEKSKEENYVIKGRLSEKEKEIKSIREKYDEDIALLKDAIHDMQQLLKNPDRLFEISKNRSFDDSVPPAK